MDALQFAYWLNGFVELNGEQPNQQQWDSIKQHLSLVFNKITPPIKPNIYPQQHVVGLSDLPNSIKPMAIC